MGLYRGPWWFLEEGLLILCLTTTNLSVVSEDLYGPNIHDIPEVSIVKHLLLLNYQSMSTTGIKELGNGYLYDIILS